MLGAIIGQKTAQSQRFLKDGTRIPVTSVNVADNTVICLKNKDKHGYDAIQIGFGITKKANKATLGHIKGANLKSAPRFFREIRTDGFQSDQSPKP